MKKRLYAFLLALCLTLALLPAAASAATTPATVDQATVEERIEALKNALVGKYFTVSGTGKCLSHSGAGCTNCAMMYTVQSRWMQNVVDLVPAANNSSPFEFYYDGGAWVRGTTCVGFANFAGWYIFAQKPSDTVKFKKIIHSSFTAETMEQAMPGDIIAVGDSSFVHAAILISKDSDGIQVLQCNYSNPWNWKITQGKIKYSSYTYATISRAENYDTTFFEHSTSCDPVQGSCFTDDTDLAAKLDYIFNTYAPGAVFPATESVDGVAIGVPSSHYYSRGHQFARWCSYKLFGYVDSVEAGESGKYTFTEVLTYSQGKNKSVDELAFLLKAGLNGTACGSHLRISYYRSYIVLKVNSDSITVLDADMNGDGKVWVYDLTYTELAEVVKAAQKRFPQYDDLNVFVHQPVIIPKTFSVALNANGGEVSPASITVTEGQAYSTLPTPTRSGHKFLGWYTAPNGGSEMTAASTVVAADHALYAHWEKTDPTYGRLPFIDIQPYPAGHFTDIGLGEWYDENVMSVYRLGLMRGTGENRFSPNDNVTIAEAVTMAARLHNTYYENGETFESFDRGNWYDPYVNYLKRNSLLPENYDYERPATREEFAHILAAAFPAQALEAQRTAARSFADGGRITYRADVEQLYMAGVINGVEENSQLYFKPGDPITRAEAAAIVTRMAKPDLRIL